MLPIAANDLSLTPILSSLSALILQPCQGTGLHEVLCTADRKRNRWVKEAKQRSPLIALLLLVSLGGSFVWHATQVRNLRGQLKTQLAGHENLKHELLAQTVCSPLHPDPDFTCLGHL